MIKARPCAGDLAVGEAFLQGGRAVHLAQISRLRRGRRRPRDEAPDGRLQGPRRDRDRGPQHQARPRRHPRDRVLRADAAARSPAAAIPSCAAARRWRRWTTSPTAAGSRTRRRAISPRPIASCASTEHRLQMVADEQTHTLPAEREALERFARFLGFAGRDAFADALLDHLRKVQRHYARLFEDAPAAEASRRALAFPPDADDTETLDKLAAMGFRRPVEVSQAVRRWLSGEYRSLQERVRARASRRAGAGADRSSGARGKSRRARSTALDRFLAGLHGGARLLSLLRRNPDLVALLALALGTAPRLADILALHPQVMDALIEPSFFGALPDAEKLAAELARIARRGAHLRGPARPRAPVRPGADVPDRRAHPLRHRVGRAGGRSLRAARRRDRPRGASRRGGEFRRGAWPSARPGERRARARQARRARDDGGLRPRPDHRLRLRRERAAVRRRAAALRHAVFRAR